MIGVVDYGGGNLASVGHALDRIQTGWQLVCNRPEVEAVDSLIFPGVGAAGPAMQGLRVRGLETAIQQFVSSGRPYLGICLGHQLLFQRSAEDASACLGILTGEVVRLKTAEKVPHVGWNTVELHHPNRLFEGVEDEAFYFTHSFVADAGDEVVTARTTHGVPFVSAVSAAGVFGVQFHPERSGDAGLRLLANFVGISQGATGNAH